MDATPRKEVDLLYLTELAMSRDFPKLGISFFENGSRQKTKTVVAHSLCFERNDDPNFILLLRQANLL